MKKHWIAVLVIAVLAGTAARAADQPNVIILTVDALRADHVGYYGYGRDTTPNIDGLAKRGAIFTDVSSHIPLTNPSISTMFISRPPSETGANRNGVPIRPGLIALPGMLRNRGYTTAAVVGSAPLYHSRSGLNQYFDYWEDGGLALQLELDAGTLTRRAAKLITSGSLTEPFMFWIHYAEPHQPHAPASGHSFRHDPPQNGERRAIEDYYDSEIARDDENIGILLKLMDERGLLDNALIIISADHGENMGGEKVFFGHGRRLYQSILHVPLVLCGPGIPAGKKISAPAQIMDYTPTILGYLGLPPGPDMKGRNLMPAILHDQAPKPVPFFFESYSVMALDIPGVRKKAAQSPPVVIGLRSNNVKITYGFKKNFWEMYDLTTDPDEMNNLYDPQSLEFKAMSDQLIEWYDNRGREEPPIPPITKSGG